MQKIIEYKGEKLYTKHFENVSDDVFNTIKEEYYKKPEISDVDNQIIKLFNGSIKNDKITQYYFKDLMSKVKLYHSKWSIEDVFNNKELIGFFLSKTRENKKIFPDTLSDCKKIETALRLGGKGCATKPTNFPLKTAKYIIEKYNINNNYYDFSCGWGVRLMASLVNNVNYFGTDPNYLLTQRLGMLSKHTRKLTGTSVDVDIRTQGSEVFVPEWENKIGLAFSSPPYFCLEDYKVGNQSYKEGVSYSDWKESYLEPTIQNIYKYLVKGGYFCLNVKNFNKFDLVGDCIALSKRTGFVFVDVLRLDNIQRCNSLGGFNDNSEKIIVFKK